MRIHVTTAGSSDHHLAARKVITDLARADVVGIHQLEPDPRRADVVLFVDLHQHPEDPLLRTFRHHELVRELSEKVYVLDQRDRPFVTQPGIYPSGSSRWRRVRAVCGGPYPVLPNALPPTDVEPDLLFSFLGSRTHPVREALLALDHPRGLVADTSGDSALFWQNPSDTVERWQALERYAAAIRRSKFVLCPRGHGTSTFRLYETLSAGRVPVVLSDEWLPPPGVAWDTCIVRIDERSASRLVHVLEQAEAAWNEKAHAARRIWRQHFAGDRLWHHYGESLSGLEQERRGATRPPPPWWLQIPVARLTARRALGAIRAR